MPPIVVLPFFFISFGRPLVPLGAPKTIFGGEGDEIDHEEHSAAFTPTITIGNIAQNGIRNR